MLPFLLIILYTCLLTAVLIKLTRRDRPFFSKKQVAASFLVKIVFGMLYGFLFLRFYHGDDTWQYHRDAVVEYHRLLQHPLQFVKDTFTQTTGSISLEAAASTHNSFWSDFEEVVFIRMLVVFNVLSFGHYYVNVVLFCFVAYLGNLLFFRLLVSYFPRPAFLLQLAVFYYPAVLFWLSGIRKEGLLFLGIAAALYYSDKLLQHNKQKFKNTMLLAAALVVLLLIRNMVVLCLAPPLLGWYLHHRIKLPVQYAFTGACMMFAVFFFTSGFIPRVPDLAQKVAERQYSFLALTAKTRLTLDSLHSTPAAFIRVLPQAMNHAFLRPYITAGGPALQLVSALDVFLFFGCAAAAFFYRRAAWRSVFLHPLILTCCFTALAGYLLVGYIVPFPGAIVRYKSLFELLFVSSFAIMAGSSGVVTLKK